MRVSSRHTLRLEHIWYIPEHCPREQGPAGKDDAEEDVHINVCSQLTGRYGPSHYSCCNTANPKLHVHFVAFNDCYKGDFLLCIYFKARPAGFDGT